MPDADPLVDVRAALADLDATCERAIAAINARPPDEAFADVGELADLLTGHLRRLTSLAAAVRTRSAGRIWDSERMTLTTLADRIGVSTTRAHQIIQSVKQQERP